MDMALTGIAMYVITYVFNRIGKKFKVKVDKGWFIAILSLLVGSMYYVLQMQYPDALANAGVFMTGAFGASQGIWLILNNLMSSKGDALS